MPVWMKLISLLILGDLGISIEIGWVCLMGRWELIGIGIPKVEWCWE